MTSNVSPVPFTTVAQSIPPNVFADMDRKVAAAVAGGRPGERQVFAVRWQAELPQGGAGMVSQYV